MKVKAIFLVALVGIIGVSSFLYSAKSEAVFSTMVACMHNGEVFTIIDSDGINTEMLCEAEHHAISGENVVHSRVHSLDCVLSENEIVIGD